MSGMKNFVFFATYFNATIYSNQIFTCKNRDKKNIFGYMTHFLYLCSQK